MKVDLKTWQAFAIIAVVLIAPHLNGFVALGLAIWCLLIVALDFLADNADAMNALHGDQYGVDWVYPAAMALEDEMSTDKVDAREAWISEARRLLSRAMFSVAACDADAMKLAGDAVMEHLRTQPEGYVLVPVEPTEAMIDAYLVAEWEVVCADDMGLSVSGPKKKFRAGYKATIAAAQEGK